MDIILLNPRAFVVFKSKIVFCPISINIFVANKTESEMKSLLVCVGILFVVCVVTSQETVHSSWVKINFHFDFEFSWIFFFSFSSDEPIVKGPLKLPDKKYHIGNYFKVNWVYPGFVPCSIVHSIWLIFLFRFIRQTDWFNAYRYCRSIKMKLASVPTELAYERMKELIHAHGKLTVILLNSFRRKYAKLNCHHITMCRFGTWKLLGVWNWFGCQRQWILLDVEWSTFHFYCLGRWWTKSFGCY